MFGFFARFVVVFSGTQTCSEFAGAQALLPSTERWSAFSVVAYAVRERFHGQLQELNARVCRNIQYVQPGGAIQSHASKTALNITARKLLFVRWSDQT